MADEKPQVKLLVLEESALRSMAATARFVTAFPFLAALNAAPPTPAGRGCGSCQKNRAAGQQMNQVKLAISGMSADDKVRLKEMLGAQRARVTYNQNGRIVEKTF